MYYYWSCDKYVILTYHIITMENPTNTRNVVLIPNIANVQKLMSPSSKRKYLFSSLWFKLTLNVVCTELYSTLQPTLH